MFVGLKRRVFSGKRTFIARRVSTIHPVPVIDSETKFPVQRIEAQICGQLYQQWRAKGWKRYKDAPEHGVNARLEYYDNKYIVGKTSSSNVLIFPGVPSSFLSFVPLINHLNSLGVRIILPKFPDYSLTKSTKYFRHSPEERAEVVKTILRQSDSLRFDALISHSSGVYTGSQLLRDPKGPAIRSFVWFNPCPAETTLPMSPEWFMSMGLKLSQTAFGGSLVDKLFQRILIATGNSFAGNHVDTLMLGIYVLHYCHPRQMASDLCTIREKQMPLLLAFSDNDKVVSKGMYANLANALGVSAEDAFMFDKNGLQQTRGSCPDWLTMLRFVSGGHFCHTKYSDIVNKAVETHLNNVKSARC